MIKASLRSIFLLALIIINYGSVNAQVKLPGFITDGMVLQRNADIKIWGWASANEKISVSFNDATYNTVADEKGNWSLTLSPMSAGGPYEMRIAGLNVLTIKDIMIGDIWVCSGQSNMELNMKRASPLYPDIIANCKNENIRQFIVPKTYNFSGPQKDTGPGKWIKADPDNIMDFSAVAYFFARELYARYKVPIGLINASLGGTPAEAWMSEKALEEFPEYYAQLQRYKDTALINSIERGDKKRSDDWYRQLRITDEGFKNKSSVWYNPEIPTDDWDLMQIPGFWADTRVGPVNGVVWFRKEFTVPASMAGNKVKLLLGRIIDADSVYVNGVFVGTTGYQYPPRRYEIPAGVLKDGKNLIVVRVISNIGKGGFVTDKPYEITYNGDTVDLKGEWKLKVGAVMKPLPGKAFISYTPGGLYNAMIAPLKNLSIQGVIWYQGESNAERADEYGRLLPALINDWRRTWNAGDFPFLVVQLPNFMEPDVTPAEKSSWALMRESQSKALSLPNTGLVVTIDLGEWNDIHPLNKMDVGKRIALAAEKIAYNDQQVIYSGPVYKSYKVKGNKIIISFSNTGSGLYAKGDGKLRSFSIAGADQKFFWAEARIQGNNIIVWCKNVMKPVAVRYAWANNPADANLYNKEGLPAAPFRTDNWVSK